MKSYLQELENNEAILLIYLANELPEADRAKVDGMLVSDPKLRNQLENLRQTQELGFAALASLDAMSRPPVAPIRAQNQVSQLVRRWVDKRKRAETAAFGPQRRMPWFRTAFAMAASLVIVCYIWAVYHTSPPQMTLNPLQPRELSVEERVALLQSSFEDSNTDDPNLHVAEVAAVTPADTEDLADTSAGSDSNYKGGEP